MKKFFIFLLMIQSLIAFGQIEKAIPIGNVCISGSLTINVGQTVTLSSVYNAQCPQCYDWDINGSTTSSDDSTVGNLQIVGSDIDKTVTIKGLAVGCGTVNLTYFTESGCNNCSVAVCVIDPPNCNAPTLSGVFFCRGGGQKTSGFLYINDNAVDWSKISSINIWLNGATFASGSDTMVLTPPFNSPPIGLPVYDSVPGDCYYGNSFGAIITVNYNNGCQSVEIGDNWYDYSTPPSLQSKNDIKVYPNPTNSTVEFKGDNLEKYNISIFNLNGNEIISKSRVTGKIDLSKQASGIYIYKIEDNGKVIQEGKINKK